MAIDVVTEEIATNLEEVAAVTRGISGKGVGLVVGGLVVGAAVGLYIGYRFNREKIRAEAFKESEVEIEKMRAYYEQKTVAAQEKPTLEEVVEERGYVVVEEIKPPDTSSKTSTSRKRPTRPPVPVAEAVIPPPTPPPPPPKDEEFVWDYAAELAARTAELPYVLHQDEFKSSETGYRQVVYTYYAGDDVLVGEDERPLPHADIIVGQDNLKWGHGADDVDVVFVRNEHMELEMEICRTSASYEEEVLGLDRDESN
jgi:hypothetical protein